MTLLILLAALAVAFLASVGLGVLVVLAESHARAPSDAAEPDPGRIARRTSR